MAVIFVFINWEEGGVGKWVGNYLKDAAPFL